MFEDSEKEFVDAIEEGRIVRVPQDYATREGLLILKRAQQPKTDSNKMQEYMKTSPRLRGDRKVYADLDKYRKPLRTENEIITSLVDNFHWILVNKRKSLNLVRKQVAVALGVTEEDIKMLENGVLPRNDYVLINKLESYYGVSLRKDPNFKVTPRKDISPARPNIEESPRKDAENLLFNSVEIEEDFDKA